MKNRGCHVQKCIFFSSITPLCYAFQSKFIYTLGWLYYNKVVCQQVCSLHLTVCVFLCVNSWHMVAIMPWRQSWRKFQSCRAEAKVLLPHTGTSMCTHNHSTVQVCDCSAKSAHNIIFLLLEVLTSQWKILRNKPKAFLHLISHSFCVMHLSPFFSLAHTFQP